jgi:xylulokinase
MRLVIGVDSSTQSTKVEIRRLDDGALLASASAPHPPTNPPRSEQDPESWWRALVAAISDAGRRVPLSDVAAISVAAQQQGLVALDASGRVIRPAKLWNDTESAPEISALIESLGSAGFAESCGSVPTASFVLAKLAWLKHREPENFNRLAHALLPHDWITWRLSGNFVTDRGDASGTAYWSPRDGTYHFDLLAMVDGSRDWSAMVPKVLAPTDLAGTITREAARALGLNDNVIVGAGTGDNMAGALGIGLRPRDVAISLGTSGTVYAVSNTATADVTGAVAGFADADGEFLPLVCTLNATKVTDVFQRMLNLDRDIFNRLALETPAGAGGLVLVAHLDGERTPNRPNATGALLGLRSGTTPGQVARAAFEGVLCGLLAGADALAAVGVPIDGRVSMLGGGARAPAYRKIMADLLGRPVVVPEAGEHVAAGACVQAAAALTGVRPSAIATKWGFGTGIVVEPDLSVDRAAVRAAYTAAAAKL